MSDPKETLGQRVAREWYGGLLCLGDGGRADEIRLAALVDRLAAPEWTAERPTKAGLYLIRCLDCTNTLRVMPGCVYADDADRPDPPFYYLDLNGAKRLGTKAGAWDVDAEWLSLAPLLTPGAPAPEHSCAVRSNRACVWLADGTKVVIRRGKGAEAAEVWPEVTPQGRVTIQEAPAPSPEPGEEERLRGALVAVRGRLNMLARYMETAAYRWDDEAHAQIRKANEALKEADSALRPGKDATMRGPGNDPRPT